MRLTDTIILGQSRPESNGNEGVLHILQTSQTETSPSDGLESYPGYLFKEGFSRDTVSIFYSPQSNALNW